ncbi:hypothetical protein WJX74_011094 [Apatococcus lobatus]|uniref:S5 DRBM domain-containing protein n=1 Tax=Apatococcus lobatus TaxID=904363 RepID=A0AAW1QHI5_9CHLO
MRTQLVKLGTRALQRICRHEEAFWVSEGSAAGAPPSRAFSWSTRPVPALIYLAAAASQPTFLQPRSFQTSAAQQRAQDSDRSDTPSSAPGAEREANAAADEGGSNQGEVRAEADSSELVAAETGAAGDDLNAADEDDGDFNLDGLEDIEASMDEEDVMEGGDSGYQSEDDMTEDEKLVHSVTTASKKRQRFLLQQLLSGKAGVDMGTQMLAMSEEEARFKEDMADTFNMQVVDINRTTKGMKSGGIVRYGSLVVVGNGNGVLGLGQGKSANLASSISKAYNRAMEHLFFIPRFRDHTVFAKRKSKYGRALVYIYPKSAGTGVAANPMVTNICHLAGLQDVGVKVHGSRNPSNTVKALLHALQNSAGEDFLGEQGIRAMAASQAAPGSAMQPEL